MTIDEQAKWLEDLANVLDRNPHFRFYTSEGHVRLSFSPEEEDATLLTTPELRETAAWVRRKRRA